MARGVHPKKEVRKAIKELTAAGWKIETAPSGHGHRWGIATCPHQHSDGAGGMSRCSQVIYGTPRSQDDHANRLRRELRMCQEVLARSGQEQGND